MSDDHNKHITAHEEWIREYFSDMTLEYWLSIDYISESEVSAYPNAKIAAEIKASPLFKALS